MKTWKTLVELLRMLQKRHPKAFLACLAGVVLAGIAAVWWLMPARREPVCFPDDAVLTAVARYGFQNSGRPTNTFYFPTKPNFGEHMVVYWREENRLIAFPTNVSPDAVRSPALVVNRTWQVNRNYFYLPSDSVGLTSTYMEPWTQAVEWMQEAVVKGRKEVLVATP